MSELFTPPPSSLWWGIVLPALLHLILVAGLLSPHLYIRRHAQQAIVLIGLRIASSVFLIGFMGEANGWWGVYSWLPWFLVNGSLWLFGSKWGLNQVSHGDCWLMRLRGESKLLPQD